MATWGSQTWGYENWGTLGDINVALSSTNLSATLSPGTVTIDNEIQVGWGGDTWGENEWGDLSGTSPQVTGIQATFSVGSIITSANADVDITGISLTATNAGAVAGSSVDFTLTGEDLQTSVGTAVTNIGVPVSGLSVSSNINSVTIDDEFLIGEGWGRQTWGNWAWGVNYSVELTGIVSTFSVGNEEAFTDITVEVSGIPLQSSINSVGTSANSDHEIVQSELITSGIGSVSVTATALVEPTSVTVTTTQGIAVGGVKTPVDVTGIELNILIGNEDTAGNADVSVTGSSMTGSAGDIVPVSGYDLTGISASFSVGQVTLTGSGLVTPTGTTLTSSVGSINITAWSEIDPGVSNTWTDVDLAA